MSIIKNGRNIFHFIFIEFSELLFFTLKPSFLTKTKETQMQSTIDEWNNISLEELLIKN